MKLDHIHIKCRDLEKAVEYYETVLGAKLFAREVIKGAPLARLDLGGTMLNLTGKVEGEDLAAPGLREKLLPRYGLGHFGVLVDDLDETVRVMKEKGAELFMEPEEVTPGTRAAFVKGPEGDLIEILQRDKPKIP